MPYDITSDIVRESTYKEVLHDASDESIGKPQPEPKVSLNGGNDPILKLGTLSLPTASIDKFVRTLFVSVT